jgi:ketosteroid isomerase-like protein
VAWAPDGGRKLRVEEDVMGAEENLAAAKRGYAAFAAGDAATAMAEMVDDIEWISPGKSAVSGTVRGKQALGEHWATFAAKGFRTTAQYWFADGDRVVVLVQQSFAEEEDSDVADVLTFNGDGKLVKFQSAADTAQLERVFGTK